jgi:SAM-dependent methyltransferase
MVSETWLEDRAEGCANATALIRHSLDWLRLHRVHPLQMAYAAQPLGYFEDVESQIGAVMLASAQDLGTNLRDLDSFNSLTPETENDDWYDQPRAFTSMHLDTLLLGFGRRRLLRLAELIGNAAPDDAIVIEVGSDSGWLADRLLGAFPRWQLTLADRSAAATTFSRAFLAARGHAARCSCSHSSMERLPFADAQFDLVIAAEVLEHSPDPVGCVAELMRVLKPQGRLAVSLPIALDIAMHPTVFTDGESMLRFFADQGLACEQHEVVVPDPSIDAICDVFPGFEGCVNAIWKRG